MPLTPGHWRQRADLCGFQTSLLNSELQDNEGFEEGHCLKINDKKIDGKRMAEYAFNIGMYCVFVAL